MKPQPTKQDQASFKIEQIGHQFKLTKPGEKGSKFPSAMELVRYLNKNKITPLNEHLIPPFYQSMLTTKKQ